MAVIGKRTPLTEEHFADFEKAFGAAPYGKSRRKDEGEAGRSRKFTREEIAKRGDNLDIAWLRDESNGGADEMAEPGEIAADIVQKLQIAMQEMGELQVLLEAPK